MNDRCENCGRRGHERCYLPPDRKLEFTVKEWAEMLDDENDSVIAKLLETTDRVLKEAQHVQLAMLYRNSLMGRKNPPLEKESFTYADKEFLKQIGVRV